MLYLCVDYIQLNECPSVTTQKTSRDGSRWRIVGRRTAAVSHTPSDRSVPHSKHSFSFRSPPRTFHHWPIRWYVRFGVATVLQGSTVTTESGSGGGNKQDSWVEMFTLIAFLCTPFRLTARATVCSWDARMHSFNIWIIFDLDYLET